MVSAGVSYTQARPRQAVFGERLTVPASSGTKTVFNRRLGFDSIEFTPAAALRLGYVPRIGGMWIRSTGGVWTDLLQRNTREPLANHPPAMNVTDRGFTGQGFPLLSTARWYIGFVRKVNDIFVDVGATVNAVASILTAENSDYSPDGFTALTVTADGTASGGATMAQDGNITFTVPAGRLWAPRRLKDLFPQEPTAPMENLFWLRFAVSASLTADTLLDQVAGFVEDEGGGITTGDTEFIPAATTTIFERSLNDEIGALEFMAQAASATTVDLTWVRH